MKVLNVVELSAVYLQLEDVLSKPDFAMSINKTVNPIISSDDLTTRNINILIRCTDLVLNELATDYIHIKRKETITASTLQISYSDLSSNVLKILNVSKNGKNVNFKQYPTCIEVEKNGELEIEYYFLPDEKTELTDDVDEFGNLIDLRIIAYGVASEYCFISGMIEEAQIWESKFKNAIENISVKQNRFVKARRWE